MCLSRMKNRLLSALRWAIARGTCRAPTVVEGLTRKNLSLYQERMTDMYGSATELRAVLEEHRQIQEERDFLDYISSVWGSLEKWEKEYLFTLLNAKSSSYQKKLKPISDNALVSAHKELDSLTQEEYYILCATPTVGAGVGWLEHILSSIKEIWTQHPRASSIKIEKYPSDSIFPRGLTITVQGDLL